MGTLALGELWRCALFNELIYLPAFHSERLCLLPGRFNLELNSPQRENGAISVSAVCSATMQPQSETGLRWVLLTVIFFFSPIMT